MDEAEEMLEAVLCWTRSVADWKELVERVPLGLDPKDAKSALVRAQKQLLERRAELLEAVRHGL